ncbi:MAG: hypothetical protein OXG27_12655 [Chloroflexi bacterium]|nr:hypothetical protein [Chloroflexota bacterium]
MEHVNENATTTNATHTTPGTTRGRYVGPSAARIAELVAPQQRVRFERGWFWTAAVCHGTEQEQDQLSFRQRPDGDGIDVRCRSVGCSRERIIRRLEAVTGESIWSAYTAESRPPEPAPASAEQTSEQDGTGGRSWRLALLPFIVLLMIAPLALGYDFQVVALNAVGIAWIGGLTRRLLLGRRRSLAKGGKPS